MDEEAKPNDRIIPPEEMEQRLGKHRRTLINWSDRGEFPPRVHFGPRSYGWFESSYQEWLAARRNK